jgi:hypothetical protein
MKNLKSVVLLVGAALASSGVLAQQGVDPNIVSSVTADPAEVTLSRTGFTGQASYRVSVSNKTTNDLNRVKFSATVSVVDANGSTTSAVAPIDTGIGIIDVSGSPPNCTVAGDLKSLTCNFVDAQLSPSEFAEFIFVVKAPTAGNKIKVDWTFEGYEGNGGGNGCCKTIAYTATNLIDSTTAGSTVKTHAQTFVVASNASNNNNNQVFTGTATQATATDPWRTSVTLGSGFLVNEPNKPSRTYTTTTIDEILLSQSCSALNNNQCWQSQVSIPFAVWSDTNPLLIQLDRHSSSIKNGSKLSNYVLRYSKNLTDYADIPSCSTTVKPTSGNPCIDGACVEIPLPTSPPTFIWRCNIKAVDNGGYKVL